MKTALTLLISVLVGMCCPAPGIAQSTGAHHAFRFTHTPLHTVIDSLMKWFPPPIIFLDQDVEGIYVTAYCPTDNFEQILNSVLNGTSLLWMQTGSQIILKKQHEKSAQYTSTLSGILTDSLTGDWIAGVTVYLETIDEDPNPSRLHWTFSNAFGFFSIPQIPFGHYRFILRSIGYQSDTQSISLVSDKPIQINKRMTPKEFVVHDVLVEGMQMPLSSVNGISHGVYLPSVPTDQNQYLLDGGQIYNPAHVGGVLSTFNADALNDVSIALGGVPPDYGGRVGGILDLSMREGNRKNISGLAETGSLSSSVLFEGPLADQTTFLISGRQSYPDAVLRFVQPASSPIDFGYSELTAKLVNRLNSNQQISLSGYFGNDSYRNSVSAHAQQLQNNFSWSNSMMDLRWIGITAPSLFLSSSLVYSRYGFDLQHGWTINSIPYSGTPLSSKYSIEDFNFHALAEAYYDESHTVRSGVELVHHGIDATISEFSSQTASLSLQGYSAWEASFYLQDQWKIFPGMSVNLGARATSFIGDHGSFSAIDPRFSLLISLDEQTRVYSSFSTINQFLHPYRNSGVFLLYPTTFWYPSTDSLHPTTSLHVALGFEHAMTNDEYLSSVESYYRVTNNLHEFLLDTTVAASEDLNNAVLFGTGRTYGFIFHLEKHRGNFTGSINYNLSWAYEKFSQLNNGNEFSPPFDRRHEVQIQAQYRFDENWNAGALCVFTSRQSSSITQLFILSNSPLTTNHSKGVSISNSNGGYDVIDINGSRLPGFQRMEVNISRRLLLFNLPSQFTLRFLNSYGLLDPYEWTLQQNTMRSLQWNADLRPIELFPLYPVLEFSVRF
ncbi:MAG TPA: carboxypeptidase regulatory-like domain-containing protein [Bacteroidota bacterium]|nr:carboxypeptidase regulatory-like domain-containing protein [Bacteroidota bacterium]